MAWLERMGYEVDGRAVNPSSEWLEQFRYSDFGFEFIVFLTGTFGWGPNNPGTTILNGQSRIPTFCVGINKADTNSTMLSIGIERLTANQYKFVSCAERGLRYPTLINEYQPSLSRQSDLTPICVVEDPTGTPTVGAEVFSQCKVEGEHSTVYVDCGGQSSGINLPLLMAVAIDDGAIEEPDYKLQGSIDLDDYPTPVTTLPDLQTTYAIQKKYNIPSTWGIISDTQAIGSVSQDQYDFVSANSPDKGGLLYPISHAGNNYWDGSFESIDQGYLTTILNMNSVGVKNGSDDLQTNSWGYRYFNTNAVNDNGARVCEKYNMGVIRLSTTIKGTGVLDNWLGSPSQIGSSVSFHRGLLLVPSYSFIASDEVNLDPQADILKFANTITGGWLNRGLSQGSVTYLHGGNFYDGHDGGNAPGNLVMESIGQLSRAMSKVVENVHPSVFVEYANRDDDGSGGNTPDGSDGQFTTSRPAC
jgi:hypothetical protein